MKIKDILNLLLKRNKLILNLIIIVLINLAGMTLYFKFDLTKNNSYSLSEISKEVVSNLADPLTIKVFFSENLPSPYNSVHRYLLDLLEEYSEAGNHNFNYEIINVEKNKESAADFGIFPIQVREVASDQLKFRNAHMGIAIVHGDLIEKINSISESEGLEYRITSAIKKMTGKIDALLNLESPIKITLYASSNLPLPGVPGLDKKIADIIKKCGAENYDKLEFSYIDPSKENAVSNVADKYGLAKLNWPALKDEQGKFVKSGEGMIGLVAENGNRFETIQLLSRSMFGQYMVGNLDNLKDSLNKAIDNIINTNPAIGYINGHNEKNLNDPNAGSENLRSMLSDMYEIKEIDLTKEEISDDMNTIVINGPQTEYSDYELFKIDQFLMKGRSVLFLLDSFAEISNPQMERFGGGRPIVLPVNSGLDKLLSHYGVTVNKDIVLDKKCYKANQQGMAGQDIYFIPILNSESLNKDNVITSYLKAMAWPKGSSISINEEALKGMGIKGTVLVTSSEESWLMKGRIDFMPFGMSPPFNKAEMSRRNLAVLLEGQYTSYYKGKEIPVEKKDGKTAQVKKSAISSSGIIEKAVKPARIFVTGSSQIALSNIIDKEGKSLNAIFLHNAIDYLSDNTSIQEMRTKGLEFNPLGDSRDSTRFILKLLNIAGLPLLVICIGIIVWRKRIQRKKRIMEEFAK
jgi:ABC-2 type transport system permease protein